MGWVENWCRGGRVMGRGGALFVACLGVMLACASEERRTDAARGTGRGVRLETARSVELGAVVQRARLAFRAADGRYAGGGAAYSCRVGGAKTRVGAIGNARSAEPPGFEVRVAAIGSGSALREPVEGRTVRRDDGSVSTELGVAVEVRQNVPEGVEQRWEFANPPAVHEDLVIRVATSGEEFLQVTSTGLHFVDRASGYGTRYGLSTWVGADGKETQITPVFDGRHIVLTVPRSVVERTKFPAVLDPLISPEFGLDKPLPAPLDYAENAHLARVGSTYLAVWIDDRRASSARALHAARVDAATGTLLDPFGFTVAVPPDVGLGSAVLAAMPFAVASDGTGFVVVWGETRTAMGESDIYARRITAGGSVLDGNVEGGGVLLGSATRDPAPEILFDGTHYFATWRGGSIYQTEVVGTRLDRATLSPLDSPPTATGLFDPAETSLATDGVTVLVTAAAHFVRVGVADGRVVGGVQAFAPSSTTANPVHASSVFDGSSYLVLWGDSHSLNLSRITSAGTVEVPPSDTVKGGVVVCPVGAIGVPRIVSENHETFIAFMDGTALRMSHLDPSTGNATDGSCGIDSGLPFSFAVPEEFQPYPETYIDAAAYGDEILLTHAGVERRFGRADLAARGPVQSMFDVASDSSEPAVASNGVDFLVAWNDSMPYSGARVSATRVTSDGTVLDPAGIVLFTGDRAEDIAVASAGGDYLVTWVDHDDGYTHPDRVCATRLRASDGARLDGAPGSCGLAIDSSSQVEVASDGNRYLVAWMQNSGSYGWEAKGALVEPGAGPFDAGTGALSFTLVPFTQQTRGEHLKIAATKASGPGGPSRFLVVTSTNYGPLSAALFDPERLTLGVPVILNQPVTEATNIQAVSDGTDFLVTWSSNASVPDGTFEADIPKTPIMVRLAGDGSLLPPGRIFPRTTIPFGALRLAYDGRHYWAAWGLTAGSGSDETFFTSRLDKTAAFLDGPGASGAFEVAKTTRNGELSLAANRDGRVLGAYASFEPVTYSSRVYARFLSDTPGERDGGIVYHEASIPDATSSAGGTGGASGSGGAATGGIPGTGGGGGTGGSPRDASVSGGARPSAGGTAGGSSSASGGTSTVAPPVEASVVPARGVNSDESNGCGCRMAGRVPTRAGFLTLMGLVGCLRRRTRGRRRRQVGAPRVRHSHGLNPDHE